jgi:hypothetical protein
VDQQTIKLIQRQIPAPPERTHKQSHPTHNARIGPIYPKECICRLMVAAIIDRLSLASKHRGAPFAQLGYRADF